MRVWVLLENTACAPEFHSEHGLSLLLETGGRRILLDMGQGPLFRENCEMLGLELRTVDLAVLSHGHYDHGGGAAEFLAANDHAKIYANHFAFQPHFNARGQDIGLDPRLAGHPRVVLLEGDVSPLPGVQILGSWALPVAPETGHTMLVDGRQLPEDYRHEQYLLVEEPGRRILFTGCAHRGIGNILRAFRPDIAVGGFHLRSLDDPELPRLEQALEELPCVCYTGHCTAPEVVDRLSRAFPGRVFPLRAGMELRL